MARVPASDLAHSNAGVHAIISTVLALALLTGCAAAPEPTREGVPSVSMLAAPESPQSIGAVDRQAPEYPRDAALAGIEGRVKIGYRVDETGTPIEIEIVESTSPELFNRPALLAVEQWRFQRPEHPGEVRYEDWILFYIATPIAEPWRSDPSAPPLAHHQVDRDPWPVMRIQPGYPVAAAQAGLTGFVRVQFTIGVDGGTSSFRIIESFPQGVFDEAAVNALRYWVFQPAMKDGQRVPIVAVQRLDFEIDPALGRD